ncbi:MAG TPA: hypothetical protein VKV30_02245, partial [Candidatus Angelobacter sp.]|nr:hypothetical protein [Candidatus Angelobacter sp.]
MKILLAVLMVLTMASLSSAQQPQSSADVIFINGDIYPAPPHIEIKIATRTNGAKPPVPIHGRAQAIAVSGGKIVAIGSNEEI